MRLVVIAVALVVSAFVACGGSESKMPDASGSGSNLPACTGELYDSCNPSASNCTGSNVCKAYTTSGFNVCVPAQGACVNGGCPLQNGSTVTCNTMGYCKPTAPNPTCQ